MFGFFGIGWGEIVVLGVMAGMIGMVVFALRKAAGRTNASRRPYSEVEQLRDEVEQLREEVERLRDEVALLRGPRDLKTGDAADTGIKQT